MRIFFEDTLRFPVRAEGGGPDTLKRDLVILPCTRSRRKRDARILHHPDSRNRARRFDVERRALVFMSAGAAVGNREERNADNIDRWLTGQSLASRLQQLLGELVKPAHEGDD